jgi:lipopolysaccharide export system protein LptC
MMRWLSVIFLCLVALSVWFFFSSSAAPHPKSPNPAILDGYMINATYTQYDEQGQVHTLMHAAKMTHYDKDNTSYFTQPEVLIYSRQRIPWTIEAEQGKAIHNSDQVILWGSVRIHQSPQPHYPETTISTASMTVYPHRAYAETDQPVLIIRPNTRVEAVGIQADFRQGIFKLLSAVRGQYAPPPKQD